VLVVVDMQTGFFADHAEADRMARSRGRGCLAGRRSRGSPRPDGRHRRGPGAERPTDAALLRGRRPARARSTSASLGWPASDILAAVEATGRRTAVIGGTETDVCVAQSALGLRARGFRVAVVTDATFSPGEMHALGLRRMREAGVLELHAKGVYYEWLRTLAEARRFEAAHPDLAEPPGFVL
jgi:nicotinamidase-related amidase